MDETVEEVMALSDDGGDECAISSTPATVPKKRGRPSSTEKPKKVAPLTPSRGRGRPAKGAEGANRIAVQADASDEEGTESDGDSPALNGDTAVAASKRGRKPKAKRKLLIPIESTGKGRGRPKKMAKPDDLDDDEVADDDEGATNDHKSVKKPAAKVAKKGRGRPKRANNSDDESSDDKEEKRPVGRPSSGGINLNIVRTGRGQGRPKKGVAARRAARKTANPEYIEKRGRPVTTGTVPYIATGKPRGRPPKVVQEDEVENEHSDDNDDVENGDQVLQSGE